VAWPVNELLVEPLYRGRPGVLVLHQSAWNPETRVVRISVPNSWRMQVWVNGEPRKKTSHPIPCHAAFWGDCDPVKQWDDIHISTFDMELPRGWNHFRIHLERGAEPIQAFLNVSYDMSCVHGADDLEQARFPWEALEPGYDAVNYTSTP